MTASDTGAARTGAPDVEEANVEEANKALARRWFHEGWCLGRVDLADGVFAPDFRLRGERVGPEGVRRSVRWIRACFADLSVGIDLQLAAGDTVVTHYTARGRHVAEYRGVPATGRAVAASGIQIWRVEAGRVVEDWNVFDEWGLMSQLRADP